MRFTYQTHPYDISAPGQTPILAVTSATDGTTAFGAASIDATAGQIQLDGTPAAGSRNVVIELSVGATGAVSGVSVTSGTAQASGEGRVMTLPETSAGSSIFEGFVGIVTVQDLAAIGAAAVAGASIGDVLADPAFAGDADLSARVASLRDSLGFTDGGRRV